MQLSVRPYFGFFSHLGALAGMLLTLGLFTSCGEAVTRTPAEPPEGPGRDKVANCAAQCEKVTDPVCDTEGNVYLNACLARCAGATIETEDCSICKFPLEEYQARGLQKVRLLNEYLNIILKEKDNEGGKVDTAINEAVGLFIDQNATVSVSGKNTMHFTINDYLNRIKNYAYGQVEIAWSEIGYISDMRRGTDGNYYGTITVTQVFRGYVDGKPIYRDLTRKTIEIVLKTYTISRQGEVSLECEVFLSDIGVKDTRVY